MIHYYWYFITSWHILHADTLSQVQQSSSWTICLHVTIETVFVFAQVQWSNCWYPYVKLGKPKECLTGNWQNAYWQATKHRRPYILDGMLIFRKYRFQGISVTIDFFFYLFNAMSQCPCIYNTDLPLMAIIPCGRIDWKLHLMVVDTTCKPGRVITSPRTFVFILSTHTPRTPRPPLPPTSHTHTHTHFGMCR